MDDVKFFKTEEAFRKWLHKHFNKEKELWVGFYKKSSGKESIDWPQSVSQALCFGWIDGIRKSIDDESYKIRFTPRKRDSNWSVVNIRKVNELLAAGLMHPAGLELFNNRKDKKLENYSYENRHKELSEMYLEQLRKNKKAWQYFHSKAPSYRKTAAYWVMSAVREETRLKRLKTLIDDSAANRPIAPLQKLPQKNPG